MDSTRPEIKSGITKMEIPQTRKSANGFNLLNLGFFSILF
jgi:hypothetical protein